MQYNYARPIKYNSEQEEQEAVNLKIKQLLTTSGKYPKYGSGFGSTDMRPIDNSIDWTVLKAQLFCSVTTLKKNDIVRFKNNSSDNAKYFHNHGNLKIINLLTETECSVFDPTSDRYANRIWTVKFDELEIDTNFSFNYGTDPFINVHVNDDVIKEASNATSNGEVFDDAVTTIADIGYNTVDILDVTKTKGNKMKEIKITVDGKEVVVNAAEIAAENAKTELETCSNFIAVWYDTAGDMIGDDNYKSRKEIKKELGTPARLGCTVVIYELDKKLTTNIPIVEV